MEKKREKLNYQKNKSIKESIKWRFIMVLFFVVIIPTFLSIIIFSISIAFGIIMLIFGVIGTIFNKKLYEYMVKLNVWGFEKMRIDKIGNSVQSHFYRKFYRITTFLFGLIALSIGISSLLEYFGINLESLFK